MTTNANLPAMPIELNGFGQYAPSAFTGLSKREMFAMAAMQGLCANSIAGSHHLPENIALEAVAAADALLAELEK